MSDAQIAYTDQVLSGKLGKTKDEAASCFLPHHGIVFYKSNLPVAHVFICIMCQQMQSVPESKYHDVDSFTALIKEVGLPIFQRPL
ncbi:MAG: hypothetical protein K2X86_14010 [Cytophagaceae bacterium]|nr:hypothetical protein [Cytophagaceae bacterium]